MEPVIADDRSDTAWVMLDENLVDAAGLAPWRPPTS